MDKSKKQSSWVSRAVRPLLIGAAIGIVTGVIVLVIAATVMASVQVPSAVVTPVALAAMALGSLVGGFTAARLFREQGLAVGALCGLLIFLTILIAGFGFSSATLLGVQLLLKLALTVIGGALGGVLGVNFKR